MIFYILVLNIIKRSSAISFLKILFLSPNSLHVKKTKRFYKRVSYDVMNMSIKNLSKI